MPPREKDIPLSQNPRIISVDEHGIHRRAISRNALRVIDGLQEAGFDAYVVGGGVRDLLLGEAPKDFDVATSATPEDVRDLFRSARLIGRRFRLAHVRFGGEIIEVATFRGENDNDEHRLASGRITRDNVYGDEAQDARRRDFTINALMYDPAGETIRDHVDGYSDVIARRLRLIGDPETRFREDPVRLLRALRFAVKLGLEIDGPTRAPVAELAPMLADIPPARLFDEILKLFLSGRAWPTYQALVDYGLWEVLFPGVLPDPAQPPTVLRHALRNTDQRVAEDKPVTPAFLFAALLWPAVAPLADARIRSGEADIDALAEAGEEVVGRQVRRIAIPRRFSGVAKQIWMFQPRFHNMRGKRVLALLSEKRFRAAYDFLLLRAMEDPELEPVAEWWTRIQEDDPETRQQKIFPDKRKPQPRKRQSPAT